MRGTGPHVLVETCPCRGTAPSCVCPVRGRAVLFLLAGECRVKSEVRVPRETTVPVDGQEGTGLWSVGMERYSYYL